MRYLLVLIILSYLLISGCASEQDSAPTVVTTSSGSTTELPPLSSRCGLITNREFNSSPSGDQLEPVNVRVIDGDEVAVTRLVGEQAGNVQAVRLHGVSNSGLSAFRNNLASNLISSASSPNAFLVSSGCEFIFPSGGVGILGQLFSAGGQNINEILLEAGSVQPSQLGCGDEALVGCYAGIDINQQFSSDTVNRVLWKPVSERDGNLVLLVGNTNITTVVNGQDLENTGAGNGFGSQNRANIPGGAFGGNITVNFLNSQGQRLRLGNGDDPLIIPNGAERLELAF